MTSIKASRRRRTLGAGVLLTLAAVVFAAMIALLVARTLNVAALQEQLASAQEELVQMRESNRRLSSKVTTLTQEAEYNRQLLLDVLDELDAQDRARLRERLEEQDTSSRTQEPPPRRAQRRPPPRPPEPDPPPRPPPDDPPPDDPDPDPEPVCVPVLDVCL